MEPFTSSLLCFLLILLLFHAFDFLKSWCQTNSGKLPPGPSGLPIIGNILDLDDNVHRSLTRLSRTYGPLMSLRLGQVTTIVISSASLAKEILQKRHAIFSNRTIVDAVRAHDHHNFSLAWLPVAPTWRNLRKICNSNLFNSQKLNANQELRRKKVQDLLTEVQQHCIAGVAVNVGQAAFTAALNVMSSTVFSLDLGDTSSDTAHKFKEVVRDIMDEAGKQNLADCFPILQYLDLQGRRRRMKIYFEKIFDIFDCLINERLKLRKSEGYVPANDMLETLLSIAEEDSEMMDINCIKHLLLDLFTAGTDTTSTTLEWAMTELMVNPKIMIKAREELEQTIGKGNCLKESDIAHLPFLQAIIKESMRLHPALPLLLPHRNETEVQLCGFTIPRGAKVLVNAWAIGRDASIWKDPESFDPERFLGSDIDANGKNFELIPFGAGRRICPGLPLAMRMIHLMLGSLIHSFDWKLEDEVSPENIDMEDKFGLGLVKAIPLRAVPIQI